MLFSTNMMSIKILNRGSCFVSYCYLPFTWNLLILKSLNFCIFPQLTHIYFLWWQLLFPGFKNYINSSFSVSMKVLKLFNDSKWPHYYYLSSQSCLKLWFCDLWYGINRYLAFFQISICFWGSLDSERGKEAALIPNWRSVLKNTNRIPFTWNFLILQNWKS